MIEGLIYIEILTQLNNMVYSDLIEDKDKLKLLSRIEDLVETKEFQDILWNTFLQYIKNHQQLMSYMEDVDDFFSYYFIVKLPMYMLYIILILYLWILGRDRSVAKASFTYIFGAITPIFLFTYCGQLFVNEVLLSCQNSCLNLHVF